MIAVGLIQVAILFFALLRAKGLAVMLGPEGVGVVGTMEQLVVTVTQVAAFGIPIAAMKFMSAAHSISDDAFRDSFAAFIRVMIGLALFVTTLGVVVYLSAPDLLPSLAEHGEVLVASVLGVPPMMMTIMISHTLAAAQRPKAAATYNFCFVGSVAVVGLFGAWTGGAAGFFYAAAAAGSAVVLGGMIWLRRNLGLSLWRPGVSVRHQLTLRPKVFSTAFTASVSLASLSMTMLLIRYVTIGELGEVQTGYLQAALSLALSVGSVIGTINALQLAPRMNRQQPNAERFTHAEDFANRVVLLLAAGAIPVALLPGLGLAILFTTEFLPATTALIFCLIWQVNHQFRTICLQLLIGTDHPMTGAFAGILTLATTTAAIIFLVGPVGILAAPIALILGDILAIAVMLFRLGTAVSMPVPWAVMGRFAAASAGLFGASQLFAPDVILPDLSGLILRLIYAIGVFGLIWGTMPKHLGPLAVLNWVRTKFGS